VNEDIERVSRKEKLVSPPPLPRTSYEPLVMQILIRYAPSHNFLTKGVRLCGNSDYYYYYYYYYYYE
jgi:hypothetical protein